MDDPDPANATAASKVQSRDFRCIHRLTVGRALRCAPPFCGHQSTAPSERPPYHRDPEDFLCDFRRIHRLTVGRALRCAPPFCGHQSTAPSERPPYHRDPDDFLCAFRRIHRLTVGRALRCAPPFADTKARRPRRGRPTAETRKISCEPSGAIDRSAGKGLPALPREELPREKLADAPVGVGTHSAARRPFASPCAAKSVRRTPPWPSREIPLEQPGTNQSSAASLSQPSTSRVCLPVPPIHRRNRRAGLPAKTGGAWTFSDRPAGAAARR